jgi:hypothetical protein
MASQWTRFNQSNCMFYQSNIIIENSMHGNTIFLLIAISIVWI